MAMRRRPPRDLGDVTAVYRLHWAFWLLLGFILVFGVLAVSEVGRQMGIGSGMGVFILIVCLCFALWLLWLLGHSIVLRTEGIEKVTLFGRTFAFWDQTRGLSDRGSVGVQTEHGELRLSRWTLHGSGGRTLMTWSKDMISNHLELAREILREIEVRRAARIQEAQAEQGKPPSSGFVTKTVYRDRTYEAIADAG